MISPLLEIAPPPPHWDEARVEDLTENLILTGEIDLLARQLAVCYAEMSPPAKAVSLELAHGLAQFRKRLSRATQAAL